jgi:hypothetical protein
LKTSSAEPLKEEIALELDIPIDEFYLLVSKISGQVLSL